MLNSLWFRKRSKSSQIAFRAWTLWREVKFKNQYPLPSERHDLYLDGFPRSGNTYLSAAVRQIFPQLQFASHLHAIAPVKMALKAGLPTFLLLRRPADAVGSYVLHVNLPDSRSSKTGLSEQQLCAALLDEWFTYYSFVARHREELYLLVSEHVFAKPLTALTLISERVPAAPIEADLESLWKHFHGAFVKHDATKTQGSTSFPDRKRQRQRENLKQTIHECPQFGNCQNLYAELTNDKNSVRPPTA